MGSQRVKHDLATKQQIAYMWNLKRNDTNDVKQKQIQTQRTNLQLPERKGWGKGQFGIDMYYTGIF